MSNSTGALQNYTDPLNLTTAVIMVVLGVFGVVCNGLIVNVFRKEASERTSFNLICVFRCVSNMYILITTFLILFLPKTLLGYSPYSLTTETWIIHLSNTFYMGNEYQIILIAINRFVAMFLPFYYRKIFGVKSTLAILSGIYLTRLVIFLFETIPQIKNNCFTYFSIESLAWVYDPKERCHVDDNILTVISATFIIMTAINGATLVKIIHFYKSGRNESREMKKRIRRNVFLFLQTGLQDSLYLIDLSFMLKFSQLSDARIWSYISGTFVWESIHSVDGFIMVMFNEKLSLARRRMFPPSVTTVVPVRRMTVSAVTIMPQVG